MSLRSAILILHLWSFLVLGVGCIFASSDQKSAQTMSHQVNPYTRPRYNCIDEFALVSKSELRLNLPVLGVDSINISTRLPNTQLQLAFLQGIMESGTQIEGGVGNWSMRGQITAVEEAFGIVYVSLNRGRPWPLDTIRWIRNADPNSGATIDNQKPDEFSGRTTIEVEIGVSPTVLKMLTTIDGKIGGFLEGIHPPIWLETWAEKHKLGKVQEISWERLNLEQQLKLIEYGAQRRDAIEKWEIGGIREIHGLRVKESIEVFLDKPTIFFGKLYPKGKQTIPLIQFGEKVEYAGIDYIFPFKGVELYYSDHRSTKQTYLDLDHFLTTMKIEPLSRHAHLPAPIPIKNYTALSKKRKELLALFGTEMVRRFNLFAEIEGLITAGLLVKKNLAKNNEITFDFAKKEDAVGLVNWFYEVLNGVKVLGVDVFKTLFVGIHPPEKYQSIDGLRRLGAQYRAISNKMNSRRVGEILEAVRNKIEDPNFGANENEIESWLLEMGHTEEDSIWDLGRLASSIWPHSSNFDIEKIRIKSLFSNTTTLDWFLKWQETRQGLLSHLTHDWSKDPLLFRNPKQSVLIVELQKQALKKVVTIDRTKTEKEIIGKINVILKEFHREAGIHHLLEEWMGLPK